MMRQEMVFALALVVGLMAARDGLGRTEKPLPLVPRPASVERLEGGLKLGPGSRIVIPVEGDQAWAETASLLAEKIAKRHGLELSVITDRDLRGAKPGTSAGSCAGAIVAGPAARRCADPDAFGPDPEGEAYTLLVTDAVLIDAATPHGFHNAAMTLLQLLEANGEVPAVKIVDRPRFGWRGLLLDSSRTFLPPDVIKAYIDRLSELKLNVFHWHIVDDQGWRIESKVFPKLHEVGGIVDNMSRKKLKALAKVELDEDGKRLPARRYTSAEAAASSRGYYTQDELREIVAYAARRQVTIVPEIDIPGHSTAMIAAYPELQCSGEPLEVGKVGQFLRNAICPGKEEVYQFLDQLFAELAEIFPAPYVHIGSDEVWTTEWMDAPENQWLIEKYGYVDNNGLQSYFVGRVNEILNKHGKTMLAWDEITDYAPEGAIIQAWRKQDLARVAAERGNDSVISPVTHCYIDYPQLQFTLKNLYHFEPIPAGLDPGLEGHILGGEVNLWGERVTLENIDRKAFPRLLAHAEVMWSPAEARAWNDFIQRLGPVRRDLKDRGVGFGKTWRDLALIPWPK